MAMVCTVLETHRWFVLDGRLPPDIGVDEGLDGSFKSLSALDKRRLEMHAKQEATFLSHFTHEECLAHKAQVLMLTRKDPVYNLSKEEIRLLWSSRREITNVPELLPMFLQSVRWDVAICASEARRMMLRWDSPSPLLALQLLDSKFVDPSVRGVRVVCTVVRDSGLQS